MEKKYKIEDFRGHRTEERIFVTLIAVANELADLNKSVLQIKKKLK